MSHERQCRRCGASCDVRASRCEACGIATRVLSRPRHAVLQVEARSADGPVRAVLLPPLGTRPLRVHIKGVDQLRSALDGMDARMRAAVDAAILRSAYRSNWPGYRR